MYEHLKKQVGPGVMCQVMALLLMLAGVRATGQKTGPLYPVYKDGKTGYTDRTGKLVVDYLYNSGLLFEHGYAVVTNNGRRGALDSTGKLAIPVRYTELSHWVQPDWWVAYNHPDSLRIFRLGVSKDIYSGPGKFVLGWPEINRLAVVSQSYSAPEQFTILLDYQGNKIAEAKGKGSVQFNALEEEFSGPPYKRTNRYGLKLWHDDTKALTDLNGRILFDSVGFEQFYNGLMLLHGKSRVALIDTLLQPVIPFSAGYKKMEPMYGTPYFVASRDGTLSGVIDRENKEVVPFTMKGRLRHHAGQLIEMGDDVARRYYVYDYTGKPVVEGESPIDLSLMMVRDSDNKIIEDSIRPIPIRRNDTSYQLWNGRFIGRAYPFISYAGKEGYALFSDGKAVGLLNQRGEVVLPARYDQLADPVDGILAAGERVPCPACQAYPCAQSVATEDDSWINQYYYLDLKGNRIGKERYDFVQPFRAGQAQVRKNCESFLIDTNGKKLPGSDVFVFLTDIAQGVRIVQNGQKLQALMAEKGKIVSPWVTAFETKEGAVLSFVFASSWGHMTPNSMGERGLPQFHKGLIRFENNGLYGLMDSTGKTIVPATYTGIHQQANHYIVSTGKGDKARMGALDARGKSIIDPVYYRVQYTKGYFRMEREEGSKTEIMEYPLN